MPDEHLQKLLDACDQLLEFYRDRGEESAPAALEIRETRRRLEQRVETTENGAPCGA
jgi:hypothetical protein